MTAVVTGGSSGIGRAIVARLAADGSEVLALGRTAARVADVDRLERVTGVVCDITDHDAAATAVADRDVEVLVCNAGIVPPLGPVHGTDAADATRAIAVNSPLTSRWSTRSCPAWSPGVAVTCS